MKLSSTDDADVACAREESQDGVVTKVGMKQMRALHGNRASSRQRGDGTPPLR